MNRFIMILLALATATSCSYAQDESATDTGNVIKYLESTIEYRSQLLVSSTSQEVLAIDIIESWLIINVGQKSDNIIQEQYFIKSDNKLTPYKELNDVLSSGEFIESVKTKNFNLNTEEDGIIFQSMLKLIDKERGLGFFEEDNTWYFIRSKFFDDIEAYVVTTDEKGGVSSVVYKEKLRKELPETLLKPGEVAYNNALGRSTVSKEENNHMHDYLLNDLNYKFEVSPRSIESVDKIAAIAVFKCALKITDETAILRTPFLLVVNNEEYIKKSSVEKVLQMPLFLESLKGKYSLRTEDDARLFQNMLDDLALFRSGYDDEVKTLYKKENMWFFVRKGRPDRLRGYVLLVDKEDAISYIEYISISDKNIAKIKENPKYSVD